MNEANNEQDYYYIDITISKAFAFAMHTKAARRPFKQLHSDDMEFLLPLKEEFFTDKFGGLKGDQFPSLPAMGSYLRALDNLLLRNSIEKTYRDELLYITLFFSNDIEQQSHERNYKNTIQAYSEFIIKLILNCRFHHNEMLKNNVYERILDWRF